MPTQDLSEPMATHSEEPRQHVRQLCVALPLKAAHDRERFIRLTELVTICGVGNRNANRDKRAERRRFLSGDVRTPSEQSDRTTSRFPERVDRRMRLLRSRIP